MYIKSVYIKLDYQFGRIHTNWQKYCSKTDCYKFYLTLTSLKFESDAL